MTDIAVLGRCVSAGALAAAGTATPVTALITGIMIGISSGISVVLAQCVGKGGRTGGTIANGIWPMLLAGIAVTVCGFCAATAVFRLLDVPGELLLDALTVVLALFLLLTAFAAEEDTGFTDVDADAWYADAAVYVRDHGIMNGTTGTTFSPDAATTRGQMAAVLYRSAGSPTVSGGSPASRA